MKLICGPMATLSHPAFRIVIEQFGGCDEYFTEMINAPSLLNNGQFEKYYIDPSPVPEKIVWQLTGKSPEPMIKASELLAELPGIGIDLNMGCSAPEIFTSGAGIAWMIKNQDETKALASGVKKVLEGKEKADGRHRRFSIKCRLGDENYTDEGFYSFIQSMVDCGVEQITLHPRTRKQKYSQKPKWEYAEVLAKKYKPQGINIVVNGDISDVESLKKVSSVCPSIDSFMIARAACQKPWIFYQIKELLAGHSDSEIKTDLYELAKLYVESVKIYQPEEFWKTRLQRFFTYYSKNFSFAHFAESSLLNSKNPEDCLERLSEYFRKVPQDQKKSILA